MFRLLAGQVHQGSGQSAMLEGTAVVCSQRVSPRTPGQGMLLEKVTFVVTKMTHETAPPSLEARGGSRADMSNGPAAGVEPADAPTLDETP